MRSVVQRALPDGPEGARDDARMREMLSRPNPGPVADRLALLHFTGRRTGRPYTVPVGVHQLGGGLAVASASRWRHNFAGGADGELTWRGERRPVRCTLVTDAERTARGYLELYERYGAAAARRLGISVSGEQAPGLEEFRDAVDTHGLSLVEVLLAQRPGGGALAPGTSDTANERTSR
ncbi:hypothetical protein ACFV0T_28270 [Streptomyces sp. NPDC059582]|uniref:hypothetical protein n=1 Tax=Streptomyces sp. NPDC059582 TaxID=3346875 RepID=UPI0036A9BFFB